MINVTFVNIHHLKSYKFFLLVVRNHSLSNLQIYSIALLTLVTTLHIKSPELISRNWKFVSFGHHRPICPLPTPCLWQPPICSLYLQGGFFKIPHIRDHTVFVFLCLTYFTYHTAIKVQPRCCECQSFLFCHS